MIIERPTVPSWGYSPPGKRDRQGGGLGIKLSRHKRSELLFHTDDGRAWLLDAMVFYVPIIDSLERMPNQEPVTKVLFYTSRQSIKTTVLRNELTLRSLETVGNSALYLAPTNSQVSDFSNKKLDRVFDYRPELKRYYIPHTCTWNVMDKEFATGSIITLRSTGGAQGASRVRGLTANDVLIDEYQSQIEEDIPVVLEVAATFDGKDGRPLAFFGLTGTPLSSQNLLDKEFNNSTQMQWHMQCPHCSEASNTKMSKAQDRHERPVSKGGWQRHLTMEHIDKEKPGLFCQWCGRDMRVPRGTPSKFDFTDEVTVLPPYGRWASHNPKGKFPGYRIVRLMMPWARWHTSTDDGILDRLESYTDRRFKNEVMALSHDSGMMPITEQMIRRICVGEERLPVLDHEVIAAGHRFRAYPVYAGLDWAMESRDNDTPSYTIFSAWALISGRLRLIFAHRFVGKGSNDPDHVMKRICFWMDNLFVKKLGADYGVGYKEVLRLMARYGEERVFSFEYKGGQTNSKTTYDAPAKKWIVSKTRTLDQMCMDIDRGKFELPPCDESEAYTKDWKRLAMEYNDRTRSIQYTKIGAEDFAHSTNYANLVKRLDHQEWDFAHAAGESLAPINYGHIPIGVSHH